MPSLDYVVSQVSGRTIVSAPGIQGPPGNPLNIKGTISAGVWSPPLNPEPADIYIAGGAITGAVVANTGDGIFWNGATWVNTGPFRGPVGATGPTGATGAPGSGSGGTAGPEVPKVYASSEDSAFLSMLSSVASGSAPLVVFLMCYDPLYPKWGAGQWVFDAAETRTGPGFFTVASGGRYKPVFANSRIVVDRFGAVPNVTKTAAVKAALALQQDVDWPDKILVAIRGTQIDETLENRSTGNAKKYKVNFVGGYAAGVSTLAIDSGTGTPTIGCAVTFGGKSAYRHQYRVTAFTTTSMTITPPLVAAVADNAAVNLFPPRFIVQGFGDYRSHGSDASYDQGMSSIRQMTSNLPILKGWGAENVITSMHLEYDVYQPPANTEAKAITCGLENDTLHWTWRDLSFDKCGYGVMIPETLDTGETTTGGGTAQNNFENIDLSGCSITSIYFGPSGTISSARQIYARSLPQVSSTGNITSYSLSGVTLTLVLSSLPGGAVANVFRPGVLMSVNIDQPGYTRQMFVKTMSGTGPWTVTADFNEARGEVPVAAPDGTTGGYVYQPSSQPTGGPVIYIGGGVEFTFDALDAEACMRNSGNGRTLFIENKGTLTINQCHVEYGGSTGDFARLISNADLGSVRIGKYKVANINCPVGTTYGLYNSSSVGTITVGDMTVRDVGIAGTFVPAYSTQGAKPIVIEEYIPLESSRVNATGDWPIGDQVLTPRKSKYMQKNTFVRETMITGTTNLSWACANNDAIAQGTSATAMRVHRRTTNGRLVFTGFKHQSSFGLPIETPIGNDLQWQCVLHRCSDDFVTLIGSPIRYTFNSGQNMGLCKSGTLLWSDPGPVLAPGMYLVTSWQTRLTTVGQTINGTPGVIAADGSWGARWYNMHGQPNRLVTGTKLGTRSTQTTGPYDASWDYTNAIGTLVSNSNAVFGPIALVGETADAGSKIQPVVTFTDSIGYGTGDTYILSQNFSFSGWLTRFINDRAPCLPLGLPGNQSRYFTTDFTNEWRGRAGIMTHGRTAIIATGTNEAAFQLGLGSGAGELTSNQIIAQIEQLADELAGYGFDNIGFATIYTRASSTDGWETLANQTVLPGFIAKIDPINNWAKSSPKFRFIIDNAVAMEDSATRKFKATPAALVTTAEGTPTGTVINVAATLTLDQYRGYGVWHGSQLRFVLSNTAGSGGTAALTMTTGFTVPPTAGQTLRIMRSITNDGVHPAGFGHFDLAANAESQIAKIYGSP